MYIFIINIASATIYVDRRANQRKIPQLLPPENDKSEWLNISYPYMGGQMCTCIPNIKFVSNPVPRGGVHRQWCQCQQQSMIVQGSLVDKPNEPKLQDILPIFF